MSLVIRLAKTGRKNETKFRIVVKEKRSRRDGSVIDTLGFVEKAQGKTLKKIDNKKLTNWLAKGAVASASLKKLI